MVDVVNKLPVIKILNMKSLKNDSFENMVEIVNMGALTMTEMVKSSAQIDPF